jgi:nitrile hydratase accessory protein
MRPQQSELLGMPEDADGPVFRAPWEASAFAMAVKLSEQGHFTWKEWVATFSAEVKRFEQRDSFDPDHDDGSQYYQIWLAVLEKMIVSKSLINNQEVEARHQYLRDNPVTHAHVAQRKPVCVD